MWVERFPVTFLLGVQLLAMVVIPTLSNNTEPVGTIVGICALAIGAALSLELLMLPLKPVVKPFKPISLKAARAIFWVGVVAEAGSTLAGRGSYAVQLGLAKESALAAALTPFAIWLLFGAVLILWLFSAGHVSRKEAVLTVTGASLLQLWVGLERAILGQSAAFVLTLMVVAVFVKLIRMRVVAVTLLLIPLLWPPIYELRDTIRREVTGYSTQASVNAPLERLQLDKQMALIARLSPKPDGLEQTSWLTLVRTGILPGFIDRDRPALDSGTQMSVALGGSPTNAVSATAFGNVYIFGGWFGVAGLAATLALGMGAALRRNSPWALLFVALIYWNGISFNANYPNMVAQILQASTSMLFAYLVVRFVSRPSLTTTNSRPKMVR